MARLQDLCGLGYLPDEHPEQCQCDGEPVPMTCSEYVPGDPAGCARCGERADHHAADD
jgi:hypothetical protein